MRPFAEANQQFARDVVGQFAPSTERQLRWRNRMLRMLPYLPWKDLIAGSIRRQIRRAATAITLPDYPVPITRA